MSEITPDPTLAKLAQFTPSANVVDPATILFNAGRASARTPWFWKVAVLGLLIGNATTLSVLMFQDRSANVATTPTMPMQNVAPAATPTPDPVPEWQSPNLDAAQHVAALKQALDFDAMWKADPLTDLVPTSQPLTPMSSRLGEID